MVVDWLESPADTPRHLSMMHTAPSLPARPVIASTQIRGTQCIVGFRMLKRQTKASDDQLLWKGAVSYPVVEMERLLPLSPRGPQPGGGGLQGSAAALPGSLPPGSGTELPKLPMGAFRVVYAPSLPTNTFLQLLLICLIMLHLHWKSWHAMQCHYNTCCPHCQAPAGAPDTLLERAVRCLAGLCLPVGDGAWTAGPATTCAPLCSAAREGYRMEE